MKFLHAVAIAALAAALASCGGGGTTSAPPIASPPPAPPPSPPPPPPPPPTATERSTDPATAGAGIVSNFAAHFSVNPDPAVTARAKLFVMLPGTGAIPANYRQIVRTGSQRGYHAIGLTYPNDTTVAELCGASNAPECSAQARREVLTGQDASSLIAVNTANSITGRLAALLTFLNSSFPNEGWGQYLVSGQPDWSKITIAGHSQGAGHAAFAAKINSVDRAVMFSGPADNTGTAIAPWFAPAGLTPATRQFGFTHTADGIVPFSLATAIWAALGMGASGGVTSVDGVSAPYGNSQQLSTSLAAANGTIAHSMPVADVVLPLDAQGVPVYRPVWIYLAFP